jgi:glycolate oxidase iron-sulfur subunit
MNALPALHDNGALMTNTTTLSAAADFGSGAASRARRKLAALLRRELSKCAKCGACAAVCPVYAETRHEAFSARGKLMLAKALTEGRLAGTKNAQDIFNNCLVCMACVKNCGSGVRADHVITAARELMVAHRGQHPVKRTVFRHVLPKPGRLETAMKGGAALQRLVFDTIPESSGLRRRFPLPFLPPDLPVPGISPRPFLSRVPEFNAAFAARPEGSLTSFTGCAANYLYPSVGEAVLHILRACGYDVHVSGDMACCGAPALVAGESDTVRQLAAHNLALLAKLPGAVVSACGSGGLMLRHEYRQLAEEDADESNAELARRAGDIASRCLDISEFLIHTVGTQRLQPLFRRKLAQRLTYHEPCHLGRGLGVQAEPRALLRLIAPDFVEMPEAGRCCGSGGTYGMTHWTESREMLRKKMLNAARTKAALLATSCPSCMIQLTAGARIAGRDMPVFHLAELAAWAMGYEPADTAEKTRFGQLVAGAPDHGRGHP